MLAVDPRVLVPRPETEFVVEAALSLPEGARVVDVGTGSGAIALALKDERPDLAVVGTDVSADALDVARGNAERLGARRRVRRTATCSPALERRRRRLQPALRRRRRPAAAATSGFEPREALFGGADGLDVIRRLVREAADVPFVALEVGAGQAAAVAELMAGWRRRDRPRPRRPRAGRRRRAAELRGCIAAGGVAVFPSDTVYGLACDPESAAAVERMYALKGGRRASRAR